MIDETDDLEILKEEEDERQKGIDSFKNYDFKSLSSSASEEKMSGKSQTEEDDVILRRGHDSTSDEGLFIPDGDDNFQLACPPQKKRKTMMVAQCEILENDDDGKITGLDGFATMETYEVYQESSFTSEETNYTDEFTNYTYDSTCLY